MELPLDLPVQRMTDMADGMLSRREASAHGKVCREKKDAAEGW